MIRRRLLGSLRLGRIGAILAASPLACAIGLWSSRIDDNAVLRAKAVALTAERG